VSRLSFFKKSVDGVRDELGKLRRDIDAAKARVRELEALPLPREDFADFVCESIDRRSREWRERLQQALEPYRKSPCDSPIQLLLESNGAFAQPSTVFPVHVYGIFGEQIKAAIREEVGAWDWPAKVGPPRRERAAQLEKARAELARLERDAKEIMAEARAIGLDLSLPAPAPPQSESASRNVG
jgi:hypothetical protein